MSLRSASPEISIDFDLVLPSLIASNHKQFTKLIAHEVAPMIGIKERLLADRLLEQEKENSSAMGEGLAITHLQMDGLQDSITVFVKLKHAIAMRTPDSKDVDIICLLLTPEREGSAYLRTMARLSRLLRNAQICSKLRLASNEKMIRAVFEQSIIHQAAA